MKSHPCPVNTDGILLRAKSKDAAIQAALTCSNALINSFFTDRLFKMSPEIESVRKLKVHLYQGVDMNYEFDENLC